MPRPLRLLLYDRTCRGRPYLPGLSHAWQAGSLAFPLIGRFDAVHGASSWAEGLGWLASVRPEAPIAEVQFWGHGRWGLAKIGADTLDQAALRPGHPLHPPLQRIRERILPGPDGLWWFRTCEAFGMKRGQAFARAWADFLGCRAAGHTYVIALWQSGLHSLLPGEEPTWSPDEGLPPGAQSPRIALWSSRSAPNTITFLHGRVPAGW